MEDHEITIAAYKDLQRKHPTLIRKGFGFECERGWVDILDRLFSDLYKLLPIDVEFSLRQVKEKFAGLRVYYDTDPGICTEMKEQAHRLVALAEARSLHTCEYCGRPGRTWKRGGYFFTACDRHAEEKSEGYMHKPEVVEGEDRHLFRFKDGWYRYDPEVDDLVPSDGPEGGKEG
ncbi:hypothetical protein HFO84_35705 [Rhizobium leguminosarum]|uniref:hypothetical protein n=1 Tax=Rhizobium leguminosarum TaxID=384 RepID=UPI001C94C579|nr:hypothetical protein [Rhizobium leguminosarum]MBY5482619.1 hypothetical protein [Rhizobium leguminosarum]